MIDDKVLKIFSSTNVLVTGGTGMIGRQVVDMLCQAGASVKIVSLDNVNTNPAAEHVFGDLTGFDFCRDITKDMDFVFHIAGIKGSIEVTKTKPSSHFVPALMMNTNLLEASRINGVKKVVSTSSIGAYSTAEVLKETNSEEGPPMDFYAGWAKRMAEFQVKTYQIQYGLNNFSIVRPSNVYGPGDNFDPGNAMVIPTLMYRIMNNENPVMVWGDGSAVRDFVFSRDVAEGVILALYHGTKGTFVNLGGVRGYSIRELLETLRSFLEFNYVFDTTKPSGFPKRVMDITLARESIGYNPSTSLLDGLKETWDWYVANKEEYLKKQNYFKEN